LNLLRARKQGHSGIDPGPFLKSDQGKSAEPRSRLNVSQGLQPADSAHSPINEPERATRQPRGRRENSLPQSLIRLWPKTRILVIQIVRHSDQQRHAILTNDEQKDVSPPKRTATNRLPRFPERLCSCSDYSLCINPSTETGRRATTGSQALCPCGRTCMSTAFSSDTICRTLRLMVPLIIRSLAANSR
jgi:hypothetical protein